MNRREAITTIAAMPLVAMASMEAEATIISHTLMWRRSAADVENIFDEEGPIEIGTVFKSFSEQWECSNIDFRQLRRLTQQPRGSYRVVRDGEAASFVFRNFDGDPLTIRLAAIDPIPSCNL